MESNGASASRSIAPKKQQSQWLQLTPSDLSRRMRTMINLLEENENSLARDDIYFNRRQDLFRMLEEINNSYCSLAEKYDQLRSILYNVTDSGSTPSSSNADNKRRLAESLNESQFQLFDSFLDPILGNPEVDCDDTNSEFEYLNKLAAELMSTAPHNMKMKMQIRENFCDEITTDFCDRNDIHVKMANGNSAHKQAYKWSELQHQVSKLMEENLQQQAELARRNIEKRVIINKLRSQLERLKGENRALQSCISCLKVGEMSDQLRTSKLRRLFSVKHFGLGC